MHSLSFTHFLVDTINRLIILPFFSAYAGSFRVSVIHRTLTWTTWSLAYVRTWSIILLHAYTHGSWAHRQRVNTFDSEKLTIFSCAPDGIRTSVHWNLITSSTYCATGPSPHWSVSMMFNILVFLIGGICRSNFCFVFSTVFIYGIMEIQNRCPFEKNIYFM